MSSIFDPGRSSRRRASALANRGIIEGGSIFGPGGISAGFNFTGNRAGVSTGLGSFAPILAQLQGLSGGFFDQATGGLPQELRDLGEGTIDRLGNINVDRLGNESDFAGLGRLFESALTTATSDPFDLGMDISSRLRSFSERRNQRLVNRTFDRLKRSGQLGTTAGAGIASELDQNLADQDLQFDLAGLNFGQQSIQQAFQRLMGATQGREAIAGRTFGESFGLEQLGGQRALQQFGIGDQLMRLFLANQAQGSQLGLASLGGATALSQLPLAFLSAAQNAATAGSNSLFAASGVEQNNAQLARSPLLEIINAFGSLANSIAPGGFFGNSGGGS